MYGDSMNLRDLLHIGDHSASICRVLETGTVGEIYNIGGWNEKSNLDIVLTVCALLGDRKHVPVGPYAEKFE